MSWRRSSPAAAEAGARGAPSLPVRLPHEVAPLFRAWLDEHYPDRAAKVMATIQSIRGGRDNDPNFFTRMRGQGPWADLLRTRFDIACRKHDLPRAQDSAPPRPVRAAPGRPAAAALIAHARDFDGRFRRTAVTSSPMRRLALRPCFVPLLRSLAARRRLAPRRPGPSSPPVDPKVAALRDAALDERPLCLGHRRGPDHRGRPAPCRDRGRGPGPRLGGQEADRDGLRQCPGRAVRHAGLGARTRERRDPRSLPAADGRRGARQQRLDRARGRHRRDRRLRQRRCAAAAPDSAGPGQDRVRRPSHAAPTRTARATASSAPRAGRDRPSPARRARWRSSSARSAPTTTAIRIPA